MRLFLRRHPGRAFAFAAVAVGSAALLVGCGGGGGGGGGSSTSARSYAFSSATQSVSLSVDQNGRFTVYARDAAQLANGSGAQGTLSPDGHFFTQSVDGIVQFSGNTTSGGNGITGTVVANGQTVIAFTATATTPGTGATPFASSSYLGTATGSTPVMVSVDTTGHGTLWANQGTATGGGAITVQPDGAFTTADASTTGQIVTGSSPRVHLAKLGGSTLNADVAANPVTRAKWTFLVYINGANDLQTYGVLNMNQMEQVGSTSDVNIVTQWKQAACSDCGSPTWTGTRRYFVTKDTTNNINSQLVQDMGTHVDMGDWRTLLNFVTWAQQYYPADHYALVIWNHGAGWLSTRSADKLARTPRSVSIDNDTGNEIDTWQLPEALSTTPKMDAVIFDASLMQMIEVAYEIRQSTPIVVGSEESPPGAGYPYQLFLADLVATPTMTGAQLGASIVQRNFESYGTTGNNTQSVLDTSKLDNVATTLSSFADQLNLHRVDSGALEATARDTAEKYVYNENKDLWDFANRIKNGTTNTDLKNSASNLQAAIEAAVLTEKHGSQHSNSHGIAVYIPARGAYSSTYGNLALSRVTHWPTWLAQQTQ